VLSSGAAYACGRMWGVPSALVRAWRRTLAAEAACSSAAAHLTPSTASASASAACARRARQRCASPGQHDDTLSKRPHAGCSSHTDMSTHESAFLHVCAHSTTKIMACASHSPVSMAGVGHRRATEYLQPLRDAARLLGGRLKRAGCLALRTRHFRLVPLLQRMQARRRCVACAARTRASIRLIQDSALWLASEARAQPVDSPASDTARVAAAAAAAAAPAAASAARRCCSTAPARASAAAAPPAASSAARSSAHAAPRRAASAATARRSAPAAAASRSASSRTRRASACAALAGQPPGAGRSRDSAGPGRAPLPGPRLPACAARQPRVPRAPRRRARPPRQRPPRPRPRPGRARARPPPRPPGARLRAQHPQLPPVQTELQFGSPRRCP